MNFLKGLFGSPEKKVEQAISFLNLSNQQQEEKYPENEILEGIQKESQSIAERYPKLAILKTEEIIQNPTFDGSSSKKGEGTANLILGMSNLTDSEWIQVLSGALHDRRTLVANTAAKVLAKIAQLGKKDALVAIGEHIRLIRMPPTRFKNFSALFLDVLSMNKNLIKDEWIRYALNYLSECSDLTIKERALQLVVTPGNVSDEYVTSLIQQIMNDECESATSKDVLEYQKAVDELGRLISDRHISLLAPLFTHSYWRVRKHAVMTAKIALSRISPPKRKELMSYIQNAAHDPDRTVRAIAEQSLL